MLAYSCPKCHRRALIEEVRSGCVVVLEINQVAESHIVYGTRTITEPGDLDCYRCAGCQATIRDDEGMPVRERAGLVGLLTEDGQRRA